MVRSFDAAASLLATLATAGALGLALLPVHAQGMPGGGMGGMGGGMGGGPGGGRPEGSGVKAPQRQPTIEDLMAPDPWRLWLQRLRDEQAALRLDPAQQPAFDDFLSELDELQQQNALRTAHAVRRVRGATSAVTNVTRDLRREADDASNWLGALNDMDQRWQALLALLSPTQRQRLEAGYEESWRGAQRERPAPPATAQR